MTRNGMRYEVADVLTSIDDDIAPLLSGLQADPIDLCRTAQSLVALPELATGFGIPQERHVEKNLRRASDIVRTVTALDPTPIDEARPLDRRVVGTCRHFALLSCAFLRHQGIAARARCGFATYFIAGRYLDHWIIEYWHTAGKRWVRVDPEILDLEFVATPDDLDEGAFWSGGEAWTLCRDEGVDPMLFGVHGAPDAWGIGEVRGNAIRDLAALNKVEMLPWDEWGRMEASYDGRTGPEYDELIDAVATACASDEPSVIRSRYATEDLRVPAAMIV